MAKFILIQSQKTIAVTQDLDSVDVTKMELRGIKDNIKRVLPNWVGTSILILQGQHQYPAEIKDWKTVKALEQGGILTLGREIDEKDASDEAKTMADNLELAKKEKAAKVEENKKLIKDISLDNATK